MKPNTDVATQEDIPKQNEFVGFMIAWEVGTKHKAGPPVSKAKAWTCMSKDRTLTINGKSPRKNPNASGLNGV